MPPWPCMHDLRIESVLLKRDNLRCRSLTPDDSDQLDRRVLMRRLQALTQSKHAARNTHGPRRDGCICEEQNQTDRLFFRLSAERAAWPPAPSSRSSPSVLARKLLYVDTACPARPSMMTPLHCYGNEPSCSSRLDLVTDGVTLGSLGNVFLLEGPWQVHSCRPKRQNHSLYSTE